MLEADGIYRQYAELVCRFLFSLCRDAETARELTQETFYQAVRSAGRYDGGCKVSTWLCQIARHLWYQELERRSRRPGAGLPETLADPSPGPEEAFESSQDKARLMRAVLELDETAREVVLLRITGAFSFREIGEVFQKNENWARVTFYRAKQKLMKGWPT